MGSFNIDLNATIAEQSSNRKPKKEESSAFDYLASFGQGAGSLVGNVSEMLYGPGSWGAQAGASAQDYWQAEKSPRAQRLEAEQAQLMQDPNAGMWDVVSHAVRNPYLIGSAVASSAPAMAAGMGVGGLIGRGAAGILGRGLTTLESATAAGIGEGMTMAPETYVNTGGDLRATLGTMALGIVTNIVTPGAATTAAVRRLGGTSAAHVAETAANKTALRRLGVSIGEEAGQEFVQETGQQLIEGGDLPSALKSGALGALVGGVMGGGLHPFAGHGAPHAERTPEQQAAALASIQKSNEEVPNNPILQSALRMEEAQQVYENDPNNFNERQFLAAQADYYHQQDIANPEAKAAATANRLAAMEAAAQGNAKAVQQGIMDGVQAAGETIVDPNASLDDSVNAFSTMNQTGELRTAQAANQNTARGVAQVLNDELIANANINLTGKNAPEIVSETPAAPARPEKIDSHTLSMLREMTPEQLQQVISDTTNSEAVRIKAQEYLNLKRITATAPVQTPTAMPEPTVNLQNAVTAEQAAELQQARQAFIDDHERTDQGIQRARTMSEYTNEQLKEIANNYLARPSRRAYANALLESRGEEARPEPVAPQPQQRTAAVAEQPISQARTQETPQLPRDLRGAQPRWNRGSESYQPVFESDIDRALFITSQRTPSARDADYRSWLQSNGLNDAQIESGGLEVRRALREAASQLPGGTTANPVRLPIPRQVNRTGQVEQTQQRQIERAASRAAVNEDVQRRVAEARAEFATNSVNESLASIIEEADDVKLREFAAGQGPSSRYAQALVKKRTLGVPRAATPTVTPTPAAARTRNVRTMPSSFERFADQLLGQGHAAKLGEFWRKVMNRPGQRQLGAIDTSDITAEFKAGKTNDNMVSNALLDKLTEKYNKALKDKARAWARANNEPFNAREWVDPVVKIRHYDDNPKNFVIEVRGLGDKGQNPFAVARTPSGAVRDSIPGSIHLHGEITSTGLDWRNYNQYARARRNDRFPEHGSTPLSNTAELAYRVASEIAAMREDKIPSAQTLLTNNNVARQLNTLNSNFLHGPEIGVTPTTSIDGTGPQGMPASIWNRAGLTSDERIGLNEARFAWQMTRDRDYGRVAGIESRGNIFENLRYNNEGKLYAATDPVNAGGFARGSVVTDEQISQKISQNEMYARDESGGVSLRRVKMAAITNTAEAMLEENGRIPQWLENLAAREGRKEGGWFFSKPDEAAGAAPEGISHLEARSRLGNLFGDKIAGYLIDSGLIKFVHEPGADWAGRSLNDGTGRMELNIDRMTGETIKGVTLHEAFHALVPDLIGRDNYNAMLDNLQKTIDAGRAEPWMREAMHRIPESTPREHQIHEIAAYGIEQFANNPAAVSTNPLVRWAKEFMSKIRQALIQADWMPESMRMWAMKNIQPQDLAGLAKAALLGARVDTAAVERAKADTRASDAHLEHQIMYSTAPVQPPPPNSMIWMSRGMLSGANQFLRKLRTVLQDRNATLKDIIQTVGVMSEHTHLDVGGAIDRMASRLDDKIRKIILLPSARIENMLNKVGVTRAEFGEYLKNKHAPDYNKHIAQINPVRVDTNGETVGFNMTDRPGSGINTETALAYTQGIEDAAARGDAKAKAILEANQIFRNSIIKAMQDNAVEMGLESRATIDAWNKQFPNYVPFYRDMVELEQQTGLGQMTSRGVSTRSGISRNALGSSREILDPLAAASSLAVATISRGESAEVARTFANFAKAFPLIDSSTGKPMWEIGVMPSNRTVKRVNVYQVQEANGQMSQEFYNRGQAEHHARQVSGTVQELGPQNRVVVSQVNPIFDEHNILFYPVNGENHFIRFDPNSEDAMMVLRGLKASKDLGRDMGGILTVPRMFSRLVSAVSTGFSPVFSIFNPLRDIQEAMLTTMADKIPGWTVADSMSIAKNFFPAVKSIRIQLEREFRAKMSNETTQPAPEKGSWADWHRIMIEHGGMTGTRELAAGYENAQTMHERLWGESHGKTTDPNKVMTWLDKGQAVFSDATGALHNFGEGETRTPGLGWISRNVVSALKRNNEAAEAATRVAVFKRSVELYQKSGMSFEDAAKAAAAKSKNVTINFDRKGEWTSALGALYPFFNPNVQGAARLAETLFERKAVTKTVNGKEMLTYETNLSDYGKKIIGSFMALGMAGAALLAMAGFDDNQPPDYVKDRALVIPTGGDTYVAIPLSQSFSVINNIGRNLAEAARMGFNGEFSKAMSHIGKSMTQVQNFNPVGSAGNFITDLTPAFLDIPFSLYMNKDAFGRNIAQENFDPHNPTPGFTRGRQNASGISTALAKGLNYISGGDEDRAGFFNVTPDQIDFAVSQLVGGAVRDPYRLGKAIYGTAMGEDVPIEQWPLISRLGGKISSAASTRSQSYDTLTELNQLNARYKGLQDRGETEEAMQFKEENPQIAMRSELQKFFRNDSKMRKQIQAARSAGDMELVNQLNEQQDEWLKDFNQRYKELSNR